MTGRRARRFALLVSTICGAAWLCRGGLGPDAATLAPDEHLADLAPAARERGFVEPILRDPFAGPAADASSGGVRPLPLAATDGVRVPNIDTAPVDAPRGDLVVRAAIVGPTPVAYVEDGSGMQIVRVGDIVDGRNVSAIDLQGIAFADGTRLDLPAGGSRETSEFPLTVRPRPHTAATVPAIAPSMTPPPGAGSPSPAPAAAYPTPGPLPTPDSRGLAPGVNPTPDLLGPTPFLYPYPYAPPHGFGAI
jgi:hypothetical protein